MASSIYEKLLSTSKSKGAAYLVLIDPDKINGNDIPDFVGAATAAGVDGFLIGSSLLLDGTFDNTIAAAKKHTSAPVIIFPGGIQQISKEADAILFLSLISGRNAEHLIGSQVLAAPVIKRLNLEAISTAYILIDSGKITAAEFMSNTKPIPRNKPEIAVAHALAAEYLGFKLIYLEAGSGAEQSVPEEIISAVAKNCSVPLIVGGGISTPDEAQRKVSAGASFIVTGTVLEKNGSPALIKKFASAIHSPRRIYSQ
ncbi:MAG: geranylgeranylglyceryl/heptaprenylglyceryl phosphate synthase [Bacteroidota bacterium]|nr:geranylgeranylglyceryl/heptaprenylglyceryl phosphate synthase [Bacteroidota bacterium]